MRIKKNSVPFFILFLIHTFLIGLSFYKSKNKKETFILLGSIMGFSYLLEFFVLNLFKAYKYKPKVLKNKQMDNIFGAFLSQSFFIPFTAVYFTITKAGWKKKLFGSMYFSIVEMIFLHLGVYKHNWWRTIYTFILLPICFLISDGWYYLITKKHVLIRQFSFFLIIMVTETNLFLLLAILRKIRFGVGRYHGWTEHFIITPIYSITISIVTFLNFKKQNDGLAGLKVILLDACLYQIFCKSRILKIKINLMSYILIKTVMVFIYGAYRKWIFGEKELNNI
ncbi:hypothetical protein [Neobacillus cucumis]|uniref:Uncharacterized protein n=1 Tax=Neobacillus cucumis TaxID=1740721 RepID=A0A2N5HB60_9BACI|nr:hypothetical protein [Neobacillus cucumis]PLS02755.1 hypothetical protein CVD27_18185 [Neobacillus cucumis]